MKSDYDSVIYHFWRIDRLYILVQFFLEGGHSPCFPPSPPDPPLVKWMWTIKGHLTFCFWIMFLLILCINVAIKLKNFHAILPPTASNLTGVEIISRAVRRQYFCNAEDEFYFFLWKMTTLFWTVQYSYFVGVGRKPPH